MTLESLLLSVHGAMSQGILWGIMALGIYITFRVLNFADMTCDGSFALGGSITALLVVGFGWNPYVSLIIATLAGMLAGVVTGFLHTKLKIPDILSGILTMLALYSVNLRIMGKPNTPFLRVDTFVSMVNDILPDSLKENVTNIKTWVTIVLGILITIGIIALLYWFFGTEMGSALRATGNNEYMIRALGEDTDKMKIVGLLIGNGLVALSGALVAQAQGFADVNMGIGSIAIGLASIVIGEVFFHKAKSFFVKLIAVVLGAVTYRIVIAVVLQLGMNTDDMKLFTAIVVTIALSTSIIRVELFEIFQILFKSVRKENK